MYYTTMKTKISPTKQKIKKAAIELFNEQDTFSVTTNHIASQAKISPGNLYYHYKNKEEIITQIYLEMSNVFENLNSFEQILASKNPLNALYNMFEKYGELFLEYRFLLRDISTLMAIYPSLKKEFLKKQSKRIEQIESVFKYLISLGILKNMEKQEITLRAKLNWFISSYWQLFTSTTGEITKESIKESKYIVFEILLSPYLTPKGKDLYYKIQ